MIYSGLVRMLQFEGAKTCAPRNKTCSVNMSYHQDKSVMTATNRKLLGKHQSPVSALWIFVAVPATALQQLQLLF